MKALIRNKYETITESMGINWINWQTGAPLTNPAWAGGPYRLVEDYIELADGAIYDVATYPEPDEEAAPAPEIEDDTIEINGVKYTKEQLRQMLRE